ncbi:HutD family protein [Streptomyces sp. NPDC097595]|uniref:HutD/Ves family protein n=1 Tax=Streptomyces sp. NPDC097595 TaxID=3366090 RepID=UPI003804A6F5
MPIQKGTRVAPETLRADSRTPAPWKNGGGMTREVAIHPPGAGTDGFGWRVSVADVTSGGPFSAFPGVDRIITLVDGPGMVLTVDGVPRRMDTPYTPFAFPGDAATECRLLGGPVVDFNVMVRRSELTARVRVARDGTSVRAAAGTRVLAVVLGGSARLRHASVRLKPLDAALFTAGDADRLDVDGVLAIVDLVDRPGHGIGAQRRLGRM